MKEVQNTHSKLLLCRPFVCVCVLISIIFLFLSFFFFFFRCLEYFSRVRIVHPLLVWGLLQLYNNGSYFYRLLPLSPGVLPVWSFFFLSYLPLHSLVIVFLSFFFSFLLYLVSVFFFGAFLFQEGAVGCVIHKFCFCRRSTWTERWDKGIKNYCRILGRLISSNKTVRSQTKV